MSGFTLPIGTRFAIGTTLGSPVTFSTATNASAVVLSFAADPGIAQGDIVEVLTSGWEDLAGICSRVSAISGAGPYLVTLAGVDTQNTTVFPAGEGGGTARKVTAWTNITLVGEASMEGGDVEQIPVPLLARTNVAQLPGAKTGISYTLPVYFQQPMNAGFLAAEAAELAGAPVPIRRSHPAGDVQYGVAYWSVVTSSTLGRSAARACTVRAALRSREISLAAA